MDDDDGYAGPATLTVDGRDLPVQVLLDARHEPQDGKLHWFGRMTLEGDPREPALLRALASTTSRIELGTAAGRSEARIGDLDPWGRYRVTGVGTPPFAVDDPTLDD
ncbi:MAG: DUF4873 domain-containing protein [Pseudonocardia sp.]|uniref:DUF4873 domain-containing protein n=1 Tax=Pseudonocardia sp. TaxID=60912 RepID=UPI001ACD1285|nr:DUF4873 domain-containing protein [Pseudonocardia sp.]MBN9099509.1 DUF4873 domain-containing protein [Pseudonocardia sp.]